jgi:UDP-N-acetylmuramoyl-tripeptide--D-alanyl-D-alanine ligase
MHEIAVIEMGMNHVGEIRELTAIAHPEHGMITNIGPAHIEFMKTIDNIFKEKCELYEGVLKNSKGNGIFVVNADDEYLNRINKSSELTTFGENSGEIKIKISAPNIEIGKMLITNKNILEHHNLKNLAGVTIFCSKLFPNFENEFYKAASAYFQPEMNRSQWIQNIFLDAYNANPSSMKTSLNSFVESMRTKNINLDDCYFILGDMNELGEFAPEFHKEIALHVARLGIKNISFLGRYREHYLSGYARPTSHYLTKEEFYDEWKKIRNDFKYIFIKASRSMELETLSSVI